MNERKRNLSVRCIVLTWEDKQDFARIFASWRRKQLEKRLNNELDGDLIICFSYVAFCSLVIF